MHTQLIGLLFLATAASAESPAPPRTEPPKTPQITAEMRARFWRAQAEAAAAVARARQAQDAVKAAEDEMQKACGEKFIAALDATGEPSCQPKP